MNGSSKPDVYSRRFSCESPDDTFDLGRALGAKLSPGDAVLFSGGLGAGKTLFTKGILSALGFDPNEVTSPSFALVNLYNAKTPVYHIDLWRIGEGSDPVFAVGLDELTEESDAIIVIEWAEPLDRGLFPGRVVEVSIEGDSARAIEIRF